MIVWRNGEPVPGLRVRCAGPTAAASTPILDAARWHDSPSRLLLTTIVYIAVIKGILFVLSPYRFRHLAEIWIKNDARLRAGALAMIGIGALLIVFALTLYR